VTRTSAPGFPSEIAALVASEMWVRFEGGPSTGSTNDDCRELAETGAPQGSVVAALEQTRGRGRMGREWVSPRGGVYVSVLLRPATAPAEAGPLPLVVGLGVALGLESLGARIGLKWPNDVEADGGKVAGVLLESAVEGDRLRWVVAGIGVNVAPPAEPGGFWRGAAYLDEVLGRATPAAAVAAAVLDGVAAAHGRFEADGFGALLPDYEARSVLSGRAVAVGDVAGRRVASGTVVRVDESGDLVLDDSGTLVTARSGDVTLRPAGPEARA
jgi:BirA family biotin operon repressor/biotin-[acetyl-CoA-carboxylase] ligase